MIEPTEKGTFLLHVKGNTYHFLTFGSLIAWNIEKGFKEEEIFQSFIR